MAECHGAASSAARHILGAPPGDLGAMVQDTAKLRELVATSAPAIANRSPDGEDDCPCKEENETLKKQLAETKDELNGTKAELFDLSQKLDRLVEAAMDEQEERKSQAPRYPYLSSQSTDWPTRSQIQAGHILEQDRLQLPPSFPDQT